MNYANKEPLTYRKQLLAQPNPNLDVVAVDQSKFNLVWLVFPEIDNLGLEAVPTAFVKSLHASMDKTTRLMLLTPPIEFMRYWSGLHSEDMVPRLASQMPRDYMSRMQLRAHSAQARLVLKGEAVYHISTARH